MLVSLDFPFLSVASVFPIVYVLNFLNILLHEIASVFIIIITRRVSLVKQEVFTLLGHMSQLPVLSVFVFLNHQFSVQCSVDHCWTICPFSVGHYVACLSSICGLGLSKMDNQLCLCIKVLQNNGNQMTQHVIKHRYLRRV